MRNLLVFLIVVLAVFAFACSDDNKPAPDAGTDAAPVEAGVDAVVEGGTQEAGPVEAGPTEGGVDAALEASTIDGAGED